MKYYILLAAFFVSSLMTAQDKQGYQLYTKDGKKTTYKKLVDAAEDTDVLFFGEHHDNSLIHWLQLELTKTFQPKQNWFWEPK